jgi:outer membrane protein TolC
MSEPEINGKPTEAELVKLYMQLTGLPEATARSVVMYVDEPSENSPGPAAGSERKKGETEPPQPATGRLPVALLVILWFGSAAGVLAEPGSQPATNSATRRIESLPETPASLFERPMSLADAINLALQRNPSVLRAQKDLQAAQGIVIETRAIALPTIGVNGSYSAVQDSDIDSFSAPPSLLLGQPGFTFGTPQNWSTQVKLVQSFYQGGRMLSALRAARLTKEQSLLNYQTVLAGTVLEIQLAYYDVLLAQSQITVQEASVELLTRELADTTRRYDAGTVPRFNVLRAEVELANARPKLIRARSDLRIAKNNLTNLLGLTVPRDAVEDIPLKLSDKLEAEPYNLELPRAVSLALEQRTELGSLLKTEALRKEDIVNAKAGYKPILQGYIGYDAHNSVLSQDLSDDRYGWIAGAQLTWNIFDGLRTQGRIKEAKANYERAGVDVDDTARRIELDVRTAYSNFIEAREVLESQKKAVEEAEEALRLARARSEAGTGTQLDVLSAQTALTETRSTQVQALHDYAAARARLERAVGNNVPAAGKS